MNSRITIIGAGPGGYIAAIRASQLGADVTVIEQDNVGGTCLNRGCIPSKIMKTTAEIMEKFRRAPEFGIRVNAKAYLDMQQLMVRKQKMIENQTKGILNLFDRHKIHYLKGYGYIKGAGLAEVRLKDNTVLEAPWDKLILALGSEPFAVPSFPFDGKRIISSNEALNMEEIPESVMIVGGGVVGCEFAFILSSLGSQVTVVEAMPRILPLPSVDEDCSKILQREMKKRKIKLMVNRTVEKVENSGRKVRVSIGPSPFLENPSEKDKQLLTAEVNKVLVCIGRKPNTPDVCLEKIGVKMDDKGWILANERMETSASDVYAVGDILGPSKVMLAHVASSEGIIAAENAMDRKRVMKYEVVPGAIFTMPEVADVGLTEVQAKEQGYNIRSDCVLFRTLGKAQVMGEIVGQTKIVSDAENNRILGVHIVGPHATDLIAEGTLAVQTGCTVKELAETIHAHPTLSEVMLEASFKALDRSLHG
jgi:dihydrolipoamide dehydrogenase